MNSLTDLLSAPTPGSSAPTSIDPKALTSVSQQAPVDGKHHGVAGVARDILGTLGDFLLTRLHMPAMYAPAQHQRQLDEASAGFQDDPLAAAARVGHVDFAAGQKMYDTFADNQRLQALQASTIESRNARMQAAQDAIAAKTRNTAAAYLGSLDRETDPAKKAALYQSIRPQIMALGGKYKVDFSDELPETYNPDLVGAFMNGGVPLKTQRGQELSADRMTLQNDRAVDRNNTANRGITVRAETAANGQAVTTRGQDLSHVDRVRGQDLSHVDRVSGQANTDRHNRVVEGQRANQLKVGDTRTINGVLYRWDGQQAVPVK